MSDPSAVRTLRALATGLCQDAGVRIDVRQGGQWAWDPVRRTIVVAAEDLENRGLLYCAGVLAHEVGHFFVSRYVDFRLDHLPERQAPLLLNGIEDPRANTWSRRRYPGTGPWLDALTVDAEQVSPMLPDFLLFALECAREEQRGWDRAPSFKLYPPPVQAALDKTRWARREYAELLPPADLALPGDLAALETEYREKVVPRLRAERAAERPTPREQYVRRLALDALELAEREILPAALELLERDTARLARHVDATSSAGAQARAALEEGSGEAAGAMIEAARAVEEGGRPPRGHAVRLAQALLELVAETESRKRERLARSGRAVGPSARAFEAMLEEVFGELAHEAAPPAGGLDAYARALDAVRPQVDELVHRMEDLFEPRRRRALRAGHASGVRVDLRRAMRFEADPRRLDFWLRAAEPDRRDVAVSLLVDLSGSMAGDKALAALQGGALLVEVLGRLEIPFAVNGFQDEVIPLCGFGQPLTQEVREVVGEMPLECSGCRPGGHNHYQHNDDGPCLLEVAGQLAGQPGRDKLLIVITDGAPAGRHSTPQDLVEAVEKIQQRSSGMALVGIGLGDDTQHVTRYYPNAKACVAPDDLAREIADLLERALRGVSDGGRGT